MSEDVIVTVCWYYHGYNTHTEILSNYVDHKYLTREGWVKDKCHAWSR